MDAERATTDAVADGAVAVAAVDSGVRPPVTNLLETPWSTSTKWYRSLSTPARGEDDRSGYDSRSGALAPKETELETATVDFGCEKIFSRIEK